MSVSKRKVVGLAFASVAVLAIGAFVFASWRASQFQRVEVLETLKGQIIELEAIQQQLEQRRVPEDWKVGAFISTAALNQALDTLEGSRIKLAELPGVTFQIVSLEATPRSGSTRVAVTLRASSDDRPNVSVQIAGSALLLLQEVKHDAEQGSDTATFALSMLEIAPGLSWRNLTFSGSRFANRIVSSRATERLASGLTFQLPMRVPAILPLQLDNVATITAGQSSYDLRLSLPPSKIDASFVLAAPISTRQGVWIMGGERPALALPTAASLPDDRAALRERVASLEQKIEARLSKVRDPVADTALWISREYGASIFQAFNALSDEQRRISIALENPSGVLAERKFNVLGQEAGFNSSLKSGAGSLQVGQVQTRWVVGEGMQATLPIKATATAFVSSQVHPPRIFGGSRQVDAYLSGVAEESIDVALGLRVVAQAGQQALMMGPVVGCDVINLTLETESEPRLGLRQSLPLTDIPVNGIVLMDTVPREVPRAFSNGNARLQFIGEPAWITATWKNPHVEAGENGYLVRAGFETRVQEKSAGVQPTRQALAPVFQQAWAKETRPTCAARPAPVVLFNGNDIVETDDIANVARLIMGGGGRTRVPPRPPQTPQR